MQVATIIGARPQFIKAAVVSRALRASSCVREILVHTGQHYDERMSAVFFKELHIPKPDYNLGVGSGVHGAQTAQMLQGIEQILLEEKPDWVLVYGDTNSTLAGALAAVKLHVPIAHVEAGLRSFNRRMPEEINRVLTDHCADLLFAPTQTAVDNLIHEGIPTDKVQLVGDVMYDAAQFYCDTAKCHNHILADLALEPKGFVLATIHRAENTDDLMRLRPILEGLEMAAHEIPVVLPLHPRTHHVIDANDIHLPGSQSGSGTLKLIDPVGYLDMVMLEQSAAAIVTDSGGVQKEAFFHHVPCVTLRSETEWVETVSLGWNRLVYPDNAQRISEAILATINTNGAAGQPYGDGASGQLIARVLQEMAHA